MLFEFALNIVVCMFDDLVAVCSCAAPLVSISHPCPSLYCTLSVYLSPLTQFSNPNLNNKTKCKLRNIRLLPCRSNQILWRLKHLKKYIILVTPVITVLRQTRWLPRPATHTGAGETPSAPCSISLLPEAVCAVLFFLLPLTLPLLGASPPAPTFETSYRKWGLSASCPQPGNWMSGTGFVCLREGESPRFSDAAWLRMWDSDCTEPKLFKGNNKKKGIMLTGVGLKPSWKPGNRSGEDRSTEMSLNIQNKLCQKSREELQSSKKEAVQYSPRWISVICFSAQLLQTVYEILQQTHMMWKTKYSHAHLSELTLRCDTLYR